MADTYGPRESFEGIQYLRAVAALMVVVHHARHFFVEADSWSDFGLTGVDIFFVISGFIMMHATRELDPHGDRLGQAFDFFVRRVIRVVPLYWLALAYQNRSLIRGGFIDANLLSDFAFIPRFNVQFPSQILPSLILGWTLNYEMLFYVLFSIAILFGRMRYLVLVLSIFTLVLVGQLVTFDSAPFIFWTRAVLGEFALGIGVYLLCSQRKFAPPTWVATVTLIIGLAGLAKPTYGITRLLSYGLPAALVVWSGVHLGRAFKPQRILAVLGDASYSIYLTHAFVFGYCFRYLKTLSIAEPTGFNVLFVLTFSTVASTIVGIAVHYVIEKPVLRLMLHAWRNTTRFLTRPAA